MLKETLVEIVMCWSKEPSWAVLEVPGALCEWAVSK